MLHQRSIARTLPVCTAASLLLTGALMAVAGPVRADPAMPGNSGLTPSTANSKTGKTGETVAGPAPTADRALLTKQEAMLPVAREVAGLTRTSGSDIAGVRLDVGAGVVHVYRTKVDQALRLAAKAPDGVRVEVHKAAFSLAAMNTAGESIKRDSRLLGEQKIQVQSFGPAVDGSGLDVTILTDSAAAKARSDQAADSLRARYGSVIGKVSKTQRKASDKDNLFSGWRFNDYAPWYGGDRIQSNVGGCTTGFGATYNGSTPVMLTAAHCGGAGTAFYNGPRTNGTSSLMGSAVYSNGGTDVAAIGVSSVTSTINVGPAENSSQLYVGTWSSPVVGQYLCQSGSYTGEVCGLQVVDTNQSQCVAWVIFCVSWVGPLADVINSAGSGQYAVGHGDSGGPVYLRTGTSGIAVGLVSRTLTDNAAASYPAYAPDDLYCPAPEGWSYRCASGFAFAHMPGY